MADLPVPDDKRLFLLLRQLGLDDEQAYTFVQELQNMAAANLIARIEGKLDAQNAMIAAQNAMIAAQNAKLDSQRWLIGGGFALLGILIAAFRLLG